MRLIKPAKISGAVVAPGSKSFMQRAVLLAALGKGSCEIYNPASDADSLAALGVAKALGAKISEHDQHLIITPTAAAPKAARLDCGESGFLLRSTSAICALLDAEFELIGSGSLLSRPVDMIAQPLRILGVQVVLSPQGLPLRIKGPMHGGKISIAADQTSQFLSGLLMALPQAEHDSEITVLSLSSSPYIELTLQLLQQFHLQIEHSQKLEHFWIPGRQKPSAEKITVEGDWSSAAYILVAGALAGEMAVTGLNGESLQADRAILKILENAGAEVSEQGDVFKVQHADLRSFEFDCKNSPDLVPALAVLACACRGVSRIYSTDRLKTKESSRAEAITKELSKLGVKIHTGKDYMAIEGGKIKGGPANSYNDHRIAMALGLAGIISQEGVSISDTDCVKKSYRNFFDDLSFCAEPI